MSKMVRIVETGEVYRSASDVAAVLGCTVGAVVHCLKGRMPTVKGVTVRYNTERTFLEPPTEKPPRIRIISDTNGRRYYGYIAVAAAFGITSARARTLTIRNNGIFPATETPRHDDDLFGPIR